MVPVSPSLSETVLSSIRWSRSVTTSHLITHSNSTAASAVRPTTPRIPSSINWCRLKSVWNAFAFVAPASDAFLGIWWIQDSTGCPLSSWYSVCNALHVRVVAVQLHADVSMHAVATRRTVDEPALSVSVKSSSNKTRSAVVCVCESIHIYRII